MNAGGIPYTISNPASSGEYSTEFSGEYFDVYGEVQTKYSQVYWRRNPVYDLPQEIISRFHNKVMAIVGYEIDQVVTDNPTAKVNTPDNDKSVPIYHAYNHHYFAWLNGAQSEMYDLKTPKRIPNPTRTAFRNLPNATKEYPHNIVFKENPGGEFRKSYHGYPKGYAQLIYSPTQWIVEPMQIDTHNRNKSNITEQNGLQPWFLPAMEKGKNDPNSQLSPLIECPCSNRITRQVVNTSAMLISGNCPSNLLIASESDCVQAVKNVVGQDKVSSVKTVSDMSMPRGCIMIPNRGAAPGVFDVVFNADKSSNASCGDKNEKNGTFSGGMSGDHAVNVELSHDGVSAMITLSGPAQFWFGVGFDANVMADQPYAIVVDGNGQVTEHKLSNHGPGTQLKTTISIVNQHVSNGTRTLTLKRLVAGASADYYTFPSKPSAIHMIMAIGDTVNFAYHKSHDTGVLELLATSRPSCVCAPTSTTYLTYHSPNKPPEQIQYYTYCAPEPRGDMAKLKNPACQMQTYNGGLRCCLDSWFLTDMEQDAEHSGPTDTYYIKFRYYFQEYVAGDEEKQIAASHIHLHHWVFLIDQAVNDYEEDPHVGGEGIGKISAHLVASQMGIEDVPKNYSEVNFFVMTPHCHAPSCLWQELWNADSGELICNVTAKYGTGMEVFNEKDYIAIPPCIFGYQSGLLEPPKLKPDTRVTAVKYFNNSFRHLGQMAQWTGLITYT